MSDQSSVQPETSAMPGSRDFLAGARLGVVPEQPPSPWAGLSKAECLLWAFALHRAALAERLSGRESK
jgi:hypothetical protein